jgi:hypothetical protein
VVSSSWTFVLLLVVFLLFFGGLLDFLGLLWHRRRVDSLLAKLDLSEVNELHGRTEEPRPRLNELRAEMLEDVSEQGKVSDLLLARDEGRTLNEGEPSRRSSLGLEAAERGEHEINERLELPGRAAGKGSEDGLLSSGRSLGRARSTLSSNHKTVKESDDEWDKLGSVRWVDGIAVRREGELGELVSEADLVEKHGEVVAVGGDSERLVGEDAVKRELLDLVLSLGEECEVELVKLIRSVERLGVLELGE